MIIILLLLLLGGVCIIAGNIVQFLFLWCIQALQFLFSGGRYYMGGWIQSYQRNWYTTELHTFISPCKGQSWIQYQGQWWVALPLPPLSFSISPPLHHQLSVSRVGYSCVCHLFSLIVSFLFPISCVCDLHVYSHTHLSFRLLSLPCRLYCNLHVCSNTHLLPISHLRLAAQPVLCFPSMIFPCLLPIRSKYSLSK